MRTAVDQQLRIPHSAVLPTHPAPYARTPMPRLTLSTEIVPVHTTHPFVISRGGASEWRTVTVRVRDADGAEGWGEAAPSRFYGETPESVVAAVQRFQDAIGDLDAWSLEEAEARMHA